MNRHKQVSLVAPCDRRAFTVVDIDVLVAHQHGLHTRLGVDALRQFPADLQGDVLLARAFLADRARIVTAVSRIDSDHDVPPRPIGLGCPLDRVRSPLLLQVDDEPIAVGGVRTRCEGARAHRRVEIEDHAQLAVGADRAADGAYRPGALRHPLQCLAEATVLEVDDEPVGTAEREDAVLYGMTQVEDNPCFAIFRPYADIFDGRAGRRHGGEQQQQGAGYQFQSSHKRDADALLQDYVG